MRLKEAQPFPSGGPGIQSSTGVRSSVTGSITMRSFGTQSMTDQSQFGQLPPANFRPATAARVPDLESAPGLAADLSHPKKLPEIPVHYLGPLSRLKEGSAAETRHLLVLLSGPEPQRTLLEETLLLQLERYKEPVVFLRGLPGGSELPAVHPNIQVFNH